MSATNFLAVLASPRATYEEGLNFFEGKGMVRETLQQLAEDLERLGIDYNVIGAIALNQHGYRRFTEDIDLLLSPTGLQRFREELIGRGYRPAFEGATKKYRATERNVPVEIITTGEFPGDGKPKPVQFPDPSEHYIVIEGIKTVTLEKLIELKLASGLTAPHRLRDLADVQELIRVHRLGSDFALHLHPYVRDKFLELYQAIEQSAERSDE